ncbi:MAG: hypothetical protein DWQ31_09830 [Planctomycetota bacterium]|nr:MAG: hypothetical protein DWQ31_09830 [Planctomycetota bacterium]
MTLDANDPRLTAYALGELDEADRAALAAELAAAPELADVVAEIRQAGEFVQGGLAAEPAPQLTDAQRAAIEAAAESGTPTSSDSDPLPAGLSATGSRPWWSRVSVKACLAIAATLLLLAVAVPAFRSPLEKVARLTDESASMTSGEEGRDSVDLRDLGYIGNAERGGSPSGDERGASPYYLNDDSGSAPEDGWFRDGGDKRTREFETGLDVVVSSTEGETRDPDVSAIPDEEPLLDEVEVDAAEGFDFGDQQAGGEDAADYASPPSDEPEEAAAEAPRSLRHEIGDGVRWGGWQSVDGRESEQSADGEPPAETETDRASEDTERAQGQSQTQPQTTPPPPEASSPKEAERRMEQRERLRAVVNKLNQQQGEIDEIASRIAQYEMAYRMQASGEDRAKYAEALREQRRLQAQYRELTGESLTWRRSRATPNASRLMIGEQEELPLEGLQANIQVDGFRARVLLDYYFYNDRDRQFEGNFKLRLPNEASLYFFAFGETAYEYKPSVENTDQLVQAAFFNMNEARTAGTAPEEILKLRAGSWNTPKVARIVPKEKAAHAYRETVRRRVDPALVEWSGAGIFAARVFPLAPKKLHRIVVGYDVDLTRVGDKLEYVLDLPQEVPDVVVDINLAATAGSTATVTPRVEPFVSNGRAYYNIERPVGKRIALSVDAGNTLLRGEDKELETPLFAASLVADLPADKVSSASPEAIFLVDTSLSSNPDKFNVYLKLLEATLTENRDAMNRFGVLFFNIETHWWQDGLAENTPENVAALMDYARTLSLEGATDLGAAVREAARPSWSVVDSAVPGQDGGAAALPTKRDVFLLSDGALNWGQRNLHQLSAKLSHTNSQVGALFAFNTRMTGTAGNVLAHLARETGGSVFTVVQEAEVKKVARAYRQRPWRLEGVELAGGSDLLLAGRPTSIYPGQPLTLVGRGVPADDAEVVLRLRRGEESKALRIGIDQRLASPLAARTYGQVAVGQMESLGEVTEDVSVAYARHFRVTGRTCSLLMLESEADYERFNIKPEDDAFVVKSSQASQVIGEALREAADLLANPKAAFVAWLAKLEKMPGVSFQVSPALKIAMNSLSPAAFEVPSGTLECKERGADEMPADLKEQLSHGKTDYDLVQLESQRRMREYGAGDALRMLSSLVENSPGDLPLIRDVAYSAMEWKQHDQAYHLLHRVALARPYEPQMYLAMAQSLADAGRNDLALLYYEVASSGNWDGRFRDFNHIVQVDYVHFLREVAAGKRQVAMAEFARARLDRLSDRVQLDEADVVVAVMWNTDGTDVDLHVTEPSGEVCYYGHRQTEQGATLTQDCTQGFGPELYVLKKAAAGKYLVQVKYFASDANRASTRTKVYATLYRGWGTEDEVAERKAVYLTVGKGMHEVATLGVGK